MERSIRIPMTPPAGMLERAAERMEPLHVLWFEPVWLQEGGLAPVLEERRPRKEKWVKVSCTACGCSRYAEHVRGGISSGAYGFYEAARGETIASGDETFCPNCGAAVVAKRAAEVAPTGYHVPCRLHMMSVSVTGKHLVLQGWCVERRARRDLTEELVARACEAYDFTAEGCERRTAWRIAYGRGGYFTTYSRYWTTAKHWSEDWGSESEIYGLTPELVARSPLPNCKLDLYMEPRLSAARYPVAWLRLVQAHPQAENLLVNGLPFVLDDLLDAECGQPAWRQSNRFGTPKLEEIDWRKARPSKMLGLTRDELARAQREGWGSYFWRLYVGAKEHGEIISAETIRAIHELGDEGLLDLVGQAPMRKIVPYLREQFDRIEGEATAYEDEWGDPPDWPIPDSVVLRDYWAICRELGRDLDDERVRWPFDLPAAHDEIAAEQRAWRDRKKAAKLRADFKRRYEKLSAFTFELDGLRIAPVQTADALLDEATQQHHCVWSYADRHASGATAIFLIRRTAAPEISYFTLELDEENLVVRQNRGLRNRDRTPEVERFEALWLAWLRLGRPRNADGTPAVQAEIKTA